MIPWLKTLFASLSLFTSAFAGVELADVKPTDFMAGKIQAAVERGILDPHENRFDGSVPITQKEFAKSLSRLSCSEFTPKFLIPAEQDQPLKKSTIVKEIEAIVEQKLPTDFVWPASMATIRFSDLDPGSDREMAARKLRVLGILQASNGQFGNAQSMDPEVSRLELVQLLDRTFDLQECDFKLQEDRDADHFTNQVDKCPDVPGTKEGCPDIQMFVPKTSETTADSKVTLELNAAKKSDYEVVEQSEIRMGDVFKAVSVDPVSGQVFSESEPVTVTR